MGEAAVFFEHGLISKVTLGRTGREERKALLLSGWRASRLRLGQEPDLSRQSQGEWRAHGDSSEMRYGRKQECRQIARGLEGQSGTVRTNIPTGQDATEKFQTAADLT